MRLLTISGSLRADSFNSRLLAHFEGVARAAGHWARRFDRLGDLPHFNEDHEDRPATAVEDLRDTLRRHDALLLATPEYNGSIPGHLKNALDWASRPYDSGLLARLPVAVIGASPSQFGAAWAREQAEFVLGRMGAHVLPTGWGVPLADQRAEIIDDEADRQARFIVERLAVAVAVGPEGVAS